MRQTLRPTRRLLSAFAGLLPLAILSGALAALGIDAARWLSPLCWGLLAALAVLALVDALRAWRRASPSVHRHVPGSLSLGRWSELQVDIAARDDAPLALTLFDHLPAALDSAGNVEGLPQRLSLAPAQQVRAHYRVRPVKRGQFHFECCEVDLDSPWRFWSSRRRLALPGMTRVYPDFARLYGDKLLAVDHWLSQLGIAQRQRRGLGLEFNQLREFREGDSLRQIDWKATARQRTPIVREYQDERDQQIVFMLDCGRRMRSQDGELAHFDHALNACLLLGYVALRQGDAVGLSTFAGNDDRYLPPRKGTAQINQLLGSLYDLDSTQRPADYSAACRFLMTRQQRRALVVLVTNLRDEDDDELLGAIRHLERQHRVLVASLREEALDDLRRTPVRTWQQALDYCGAVEMLGARNTLHERLRAHGISVLDVRPSELGPALVSRYLNWKKAGTL